MPRAIRKVLIALGIVLALYVLFTVAFLLGPSPRPATLPNPNGYDDFVKAGAALAGDTGSFPDLEDRALRELLATNAEPLRLLRQGLSRRCSAPTDLIITNLDVRLSEWSNFKKL